MRRSSTRFHIDGPAFVRGGAALVIAIGCGVWGALLLAPEPRQLPPALDAVSTPLYDTSPVAQWFGGAALRVRVAAAGIIAADDGQGAALLSIDGAPARAYRVGQALAPGVTLDAVSPTAVFVDQDGVVEQVAVPVSPAARVQGFVPVPARQP